MTDKLFRVISHLDLGGGYRRLVLKTDGEFTAAPGQFVHLRVPGLEASALRRPFSICDAQEAIGELTILYKTVGRGTVAMNQLKASDEVRVLGPLGHGFPLKCEGVPLLVGGGFGVAPLYFLAKELLKRGEAKPKPVVFIGGRTAADLLLLEDFSRLGIEVKLATNDGSAGVSGLVTDPLDDVLIDLRGQGQAFELFACGPDPMLKAVALRATGTRSPGWISMDRHMLCGVGACYACIQKTVRGNSRCCLEGPVFSAADLVW